MHFSSIYYWTCKLFIYWKLLPQFSMTYLTSCRGCKWKRLWRVLAIQCCQNMLWSFSLTATMQISHNGNSSHDRTRCDCYKTSTTRNFVSWLFRYCHNVFWLFFRSLSVTCILNYLLRVFHKHHVIQMPWCTVFPISSNFCTTTLQN
jgi:hypothetical protein